MDAALDHMAEHGVLAGLNLREIAEQVGVTPANIYHYFGSRRGLLRAALGRETTRLAGPLEDFAELSFAERRLAVFDWVVDHPNVRLGTLLALDEDPDFEPMPFLAATVASYAAIADELPDDLDLLAVHLVTLAASVGIGIYRDAAARQLGESPDELTARVRRVLASMLDAIADPASIEPPHSR